MNPKVKFELGYYAIRKSVAFAEESELLCLQLSGTAALEVLNAICPCDIFLQDGQMKHTLLLDEEGIPFADVYACREGLNGYLIGYGPDASQVIDWIKCHSTGIEDFTVINLKESHYSLAIDGPYAWELCAEVFGGDLLGLPYLGMLIMESVMIFRAGRTGEYGYHLLVPQKQKNNWIDKILTTGQSFKLACADQAVRSQCVLENFFFDLNREGRFGLSPMELQLQWRISKQKTKYPGASAITKRRKLGWNHRLTGFTTQEPVKLQDEIMCYGEKVGRILAVGYSPLRHNYVGKALLLRPYWHAGLEGFRVGDIALETISAPAVTNLSLQISPNTHSFHRQKEDESNEV